MIGSQNRYPRVARNSRREQVGYALRHPRQFREGDALQCLLALNLKGNVVGELAGRFLESLVEGGHGSQEILQEIEGWLDCTLIDPQALEILRFELYTNIVYTILVLSEQQRIFQ